MTFCLCIFLFVRFCHIQYEDLVENILDGPEKEHSLWTAEEYDAIPTAETDEDKVPDTERDDDDFATHLFSEYDDPSESDESVEVETDDEDDDKSNFGVKRKCVFNTLKPFHCVTSMPPDSMHDLMEGKFNALAFVLLTIKGRFNLKTENLGLRPQGVCVGGGGGC